MQSSTLVSVPTPIQIKQFVKSLGPGMMMATASVGGSHLVASTKAGAIYGWQLAALIILVNLLKYPFFRASVQYTMGTCNSLVHGYAEMGRGYIYLFTFLCAIAAVVNTATLGIFSASLLAYLLPFELSITLISVILFAACLMILLHGHYQALNGVSKVIMLALIIATITALIIGVGEKQDLAKDFVAPSAWNIAAIGFIVITMGWMPAPIEISSLTSLWLKRQQREQKVTNKSALFDFNVGYLLTAVLAMVFLALGGVVMHGNVNSIEVGSIAFLQQFINSYAENIGNWSRYLIALVGFLCIFGSTITVTDGYSRALAEAKTKLENANTHHEANHHRTMLWITTVALAAIIFYSTSLMSMLNFAMMLSFITTPIFALLNYKLVVNTRLPKELELTPRMKALSWIGLAYLFGLLALFLYWKLFIA